MIACAECGQENPEEARFCNACGASLLEAAPAREVRKTVTVLFCDVTGSTALGESLDPEPLRALLARYFERMKAIVERHGGTVEKFIGDAVMAVFGVPVVHEDDALRALRAAVEMRAAFPELGIEGRIGVSTGEVVSGTEERLATGDAVNVAARLEQAAGPGEVLIGETTFRLARDAAEVEPVEPLALKGKSTPLAAFRLMSVREGAAPFMRRLDSPMVGRERERQVLRQSFDRARDERACHLFTVLGPAGIGKSRLLQEFIAAVEDEATVVSGRCLPYGEGITYWPLLEVLEALGRELAISSPEETAWAARKLFEEVAAERPLVVAFDDVQWAEPTLLDLIEHVSDLSRGARIVLLCVARPELLDARPGWGGGKLNATTILLEPLSGDEVGELVANLLEHGDLPGGVLERVEEAAEGNPLFVEEMLAMLVDDGLDGEIEIPPTIQALLAARLDRLDRSERDVLGCASVEGKVFHAGGVAMLAPDDLRPAVRSYLTGLVRKDLIRPEHPAFEGEDAFRFRHLLIRDAAYNSMPKEERADLHERFAGWLESIAGGVADYQAIVGYHLEQAYRYRAELGPLDERAVELGRRAGQLLAAAGRQALLRVDMLAAVNLLGRAEELPLDNPDRLALLPDLGDALFESGELTRAAEVLDRAVDEAAATGQKVVEDRAIIIRHFLRSSADPEWASAEARARVEGLLPELEELGDDRTLAEAWRLKALVHLTDSRFADVGEASERALLHARRAGDRRQEEDALFWLMSAYNFGPLPVDEAIARGEKLLETVAERPVMANGTLGHLAMLKAKRGDFDEARELYSRALDMRAELGREVRWGGLAMASGWIEILAGNPERAEPVLREGYERLGKIGERGFRSTLAAVYADVVYRQGRYDEADNLSRTSEELAGPDDVASQVGWRSVRAKVLARRGDFAEAERLGREAVAIVARTDHLDFRADTSADLAEVLRLAGRPVEAAGQLEEALRLYEAKGVLPAAERTRKLLAELAQPPATA